MSSSYRVFMQRDTTTLDVAALALYAKRHLDASIAAGTNETLVVSARDLEAMGDVPYALAPTSDRDRRAAEEAEARSGASGMAALARRCRTIVDLGPSASERAVLLVAAVVAGVELGPILSDSPDGAEIFGVKTARLRLARG